MFHAYDTRFDVTGNLENFLVFRVNETRPCLFLVCIGQGGLLLTPPIENDSSQTHTTTRTPRSD